MRSSHFSMEQIIYAPQGLPMLWADLGWDVQLLSSALLTSELLPVQGVA